jgi:hypothetical protein
MGRSQHSWLLAGVYTYSHHSWTLTSGVDSVPGSSQGVLPSFQDLHMGRSQRSRILTWSVASVPSFSQGV